VPNVAFVPLQESPLLTDFAETAAAIEQLDLVIGVDTAVSHLAGALRKPMWLMLPFPPNWRWQLDGPSTAWYPTMRLFRQVPDEDWSRVLDSVCSELDRAQRDFRARRPAEPGAMGRPLDRASPLGEAATLAGEPEVSPAVRRAANGSN
jgi:hypothetical protein